MRITVVGSVKFAKEIVDVYNKLKELGHDPVMHEEMFGMADGTAKQLIREAGEDHAAVKKKFDFIRAWHKIIESSDAILVCNFDQGEKKNHIGGNTFLEIGFAHVDNKKVFLLNPIPEHVEYLDEIKAMADEVKNGDLTQIK